MSDLIYSKDDPAYRQCTRTVMDNIADPDIRFDELGVCNYFYEYQDESAREVIQGEAGKLKLEHLVQKMKIHGRGKSYDCLIGLSGGVDSTYVAYLVKQYGLRPLAVHLDNGWDSELAVNNIENVIRKLGIDLFTEVINWEEFKDIQLSYLKASVVDIEVVTDHAIFATMYKVAKTHNINYIISGTNVVTEFILPHSWVYRKMDFTNIKDIHNRYGKVKMKTYPSFDFKKYVYYSAVLKLSPVSILNYIPFDLVKVKELIKNELDWRDYGGKHYESVFTKFYQSYILPKKFGIDKRKAHLSTMVCSGQMKRDEALNELSKPLYEPAQIESDKEYVLKKLDLSEPEFQAIMDLPVRRHEDFKTDVKLKESYMKILQKTAPLRTVIKKITSK